MTRNLYEDRIVVLQAEDADEAIAKAEEEAREYCAGQDIEWLGFVEVFEIADEHIGHCTEVFSHLHETDLSPRKFVDDFDDLHEISTDDPNDV